jgi:hypothetical protein
MDIENPYTSKPENKTLPQPSNGDTVKQLLASRYLLYKSRGNWTVNQERQVVT